MNEIIPGEDTILVNLDGNKTAELGVEERVEYEPAAYQTEAGWTCFDPRGEVEYFVSEAGIVYSQPSNREVGVAPAIKAVADKLDAEVEEAVEGEDYELGHRFIKLNEPEEDMQEQPDDREAKLPKWARHELQRLRANLASHEEREREAIEGGDGSVCLHEYGGTGEIPLLHDHVRYVIDAARRESIEVSWTDPKTRRSIEVRSNTNGLRLLPYSSNVVRIEIEDR